MFKQIDSMGTLDNSNKKELKERALKVDVGSIAGKKLGSVKYVKQRDSLEEHERAGIDYLLLNGELWEMKNLTNCASLVSNQVKRARIKWFKLGLSSPSRCVFTNEGNRDGFGKTCAALEKRRRHGEVFLVVSDSGVIHVLKDK